MAQQNVEVKIVGKDQASREILGVGTALDRMKTAVETNKTGFNKLDGAIKDSAANMLGLQGSAGQLAKAFLEFAPGGIVGGLAVAGIGLLVNSFIESKKAQEEAREGLIKYLDEVIKLGLAQDKLKMNETSAETRALSAQFALLVPQIFDAERETARFKVILEDIARFERENQGFLARMFGGADAVSAVYSASEIARLSNEAKDALAEQNRLLEQQANLMNRLKNIGMQQLNDDVKRLSTLRALGEVGRLTNEEKKEEDYLTTKLTNLSKNMGADAEVRLIALNAIKKTTKETVDEQKKLNEATKQQRDLFKQIEDSALRQLEARARMEQQRREESRAMIATDLQKQLEGLGISIEKQFEGFGVENFETKMQSISQLAYNISDGFDVMTQAIMQGNNAFKSLEMGARSAARNILRSFAQEQIAKGTGAIGSALTATATGNFPSAGLFYQSAAKHFAAAALAGFAGGVIGGGGSNRGGGGGFNNSNLGQVGGQRSPIYITIAGGGILDMNNPEVARSFVNAINVATNRRAIITTTGR